MKFDWFVLPFSAGTVFLLSFLVCKYLNWLKRLNRDDRMRVVQGFLSRRLLHALAEVFRESLLHKRIFSRNRILGFMHMSLAFGWFLLIVTGNLESRIYQPRSLNLPYIPIFFKFFFANPGSFPLHRLFSFLMDFLLLLVLAGVTLAFIKRLYSKAYGMKRTTRLKAGDRFALTALWLIFPLRLLAEAFTASVFGGGDFLTGTTGRLLGYILPTGNLFYPTWWAYSISLGVFFISLPFSRYMHIPTEIVLILSRHFGLCEKQVRTSFTEIEIHACSRCGICLDACQLSFAGGEQHIQSVYQLKDIRYNQVKTRETFDCLLCGRCDAVCPVGIDISGIRLITRNALNGYEPDPSFSKLLPTSSRKAEVIYFAGCMTHQTPSIKMAMLQIMQNARVDFWFMDEEGGICCGRPMFLAGHQKQAAMLMEENQQLIRSSGAHTLVTSCPICYKMFVGEYGLPIRVMHHTQFLNELVVNRQLRLRPNHTTVAYHDPCELSRDLRVYDEPRELLSKMVGLVNQEYALDNSLCCGNSLANLSATNNVRMKVAEDACNRLLSGGGQQLITSCPLCKKTFERVSPVPVLDVAELVKQSMRIHETELTALPIRHEKVQAI